MRQVQAATHIHVSATFLSYSQELLLQYGDRHQD